MTDEVSDSVFLFSLKRLSDAVRSSLNACADSANRMVCIAGTLASDGWREWGEERWWNEEEEEEEDDDEAELSIESVCAMTFGRVLSASANPL